MTELEKLYPEIEIPLDHTDVFTLLVAVALSAQTTDKKVNEITPHLFSVADTPEKMSKLEVPEIKELIKQIGLSNQKAKNLKKMSEILVQKYNGKVPASFEDLFNNKLPLQNISYRRIVVYDTELLYPEINENYDGIVFFSPSGVRSVLTNNDIGQAKVFAIGRTTEDELKKYNIKNIITNNEANLDGIFHSIKNTEF